MKRLICLFLALVLCLTVFVACDGSSNPNNDKETGESGSQTEGETNGGDENDDTTDTTGDDAGLTDLPDEKLSPSDTPVEFRMLVRQNRYDYLFYETNQTSDTVLQRVFERNAMLEEKYNVVFAIDEPSGGDATQFKTKLETIDSSNNYDIACWDFWWALEQNGLFANFTDMTEINVEDPWWYDGWNKNVTINNKQFSIVGDAALEVLQNLEVIFYNKQVAEAQDLELYDLVEDDAWTISEMMAINTQVAQGLDDDDDTNNFYGALYDVHSLRSALFSAGLVLTTVNPTEGTIKINADLTNISNAADAVSALILSREVDYSTATARARDYSLFTDANALFFASCLLIGKNMKSMGLDFDYGVLPAPKLTEEADYISTCYGASVFSIPSATVDEHRAAVVLNAMNCYSNIAWEDGIVYNFYEQVIKGRVADRPEDADMIDIARDSIRIDFAFANEGAIPALLNSVQSATVGGTSASTAYQAILRAAGIKLNELIAIYQ